MSYPDLIMKEFAKVPIEVTIFSNDISEDGAPIPSTTLNLLCNYSASSQKILTTDQSIIQINAVARIPSDPFPDIPEIASGEALIFGNKMRISSGKKIRNLDGSVNYTRLELV